MTRHGAASPGILDVHTHVYPDELAEDITRSLRREGQFEPCCPGRASDLRGFMRRDGVVVSVNLPVATKAGQVAGINRKMAAFNVTSPGDILCFGAMHPKFGEVGVVEEEIAFLARNGIRGIKLHPEYQDFFPDDPAMKPLYDACRRWGIAVVLHAGFDFPDPDHIHATPQRLREVARIPGLKVVLAHMGGFRMWEDVLRYLADTDAYFDTAFISTMPPDVFRAVVDAHGVDKILFGSDFPWTRAKTIRDLIEKALPSPRDQAKIFRLNAQEFLGLKPPSQGATG